MIATLLAPFGHGSSYKHNFKFEIGNFKKAGTSEKWDAARSLDPLGLFFADEVTAAMRADAGGVDGACRDVAALARAACVRFTVHGEGHFAIEDDVGGEASVRVIGVNLPRSIPPNKSVREAFALKLLAKVTLV